MKWSWVKKKSREEVPTKKPLEEKLFKKRYDIKGWHRAEHRLTAQELHDRVMEDSKSNYNWVASATELVRVCNEPDFPQEYAQNIKIAILKCFASLAVHSFDESYQEPTDNDAVYSCFNSLSGTDENVRSAKQTYLRGVIKGISFNRFEFPVHVGAEYSKFRNEWETAKFEEFCEQETVADFRTFFKELCADFDEKLKSAEEQGRFEAEDKEYREKSLQWITSMISKMNNDD